MDFNKGYMIRLFLILILISTNAFASTSASRVRNFVNDRNNLIPITASYMDAELDNIITKLNQKVIISGSSPSSPIAGMLWLDSTNKILKQYRNGEWVTMGIIHVGTSAPATSQTGDLFYNSTTKILFHYNGSSYVAVNNIDLSAPSMGIGTITPVSGRFTTLTTSGNVGINTTDITQGGLVVKTGNVGIGTSFPGVALDVNGTIRGTGFSGVPFIPTNIQAFTSNGTWTKPAGVGNVYVKVWGSGGSGGSNSGVGAGGGGGGYAEGFTAVTGNVTVTVGAAATACSGSPSTGGNGNTSSFAGSTTISATGGTGGTSTTGGSGGTGSNGQINITGASGNGGGTTSASPQGIGGCAFGSGYNSYGCGGNGAINTSCGATPGGLVIVYY